ncbi:hypothetical protein EDB85DRAFT_2141580 [Lactarius pseudohatsudake]|nr:hypothetical protein EDB85DRAFT_2141580 [Lactarius pseudohatsudake]
MPPRRPVADSLTEHETTLLETAVRFNAALRHWETHRGLEPVVEWYIKCIDDELKDINRIFDSYPPGDIGPRIHPLLEYVANWWDDGEKKGMIFNLDDMNLADVQDMCDKEAKSDLFSCSLLYTRLLSLFLEEQDEDAYWWLPPSFIMGDTIGWLSAGKSIDRSVGAANPDEPITPLPKDAYYALDDVEMEGEDRTETPCNVKAGKRTAVQSPTTVRHTAHRQRVGSADSTIAIPIDPDACGPCGHGRRDCYPQPGSVRALACHECTQRKLKCTPLAAWAKAIQKANSQKVKDAAKNCKKPGMEDVYQEFQLFKVEQRAHNTLVCDLAFNADAMLRALCKQAAVNLSTLRLRTPAVPLFTKPWPGTPTESSIPSPASTTTSSLHISHLHITNQPDMLEAEGKSYSTSIIRPHSLSSYWVWWYQQAPFESPECFRIAPIISYSPRMKGRNVSKLPTFSDPEDNISSGRESFDEDDMYGSDTGDDFICDSMESDGGSQEPARGIFDDVIAQAHGLCIHLENIYTLTRALCEAQEIEGVSALPLGPTLIDDLTLRTSSELIGSNIVDIEEEAENDEFGVAYW